MNGDALRTVMRVFPQGVAVVTATAEEEGPRGITVSSFISVSLEPPLVLISIAHTAQAHDALDRAGAYAVNLLAEDQGALADHFAQSGMSSEEQFSGISHKRSALGSPVIEDCLGYLDCKVVKKLAEGDHTFFIGRVEEGEVRREGRPLVFFARGYWGLGREVHQRGG
jgi:flavin reductase (DIM6/NTAB) family NADH-FMN oxidoreductase RutF